MEAGATLRRETLTSLYTLEGGMTPRGRIVAYCLDWHLTNSGAFHELFVLPLEAYAEVTLVAWDGSTLPQAPRSDDFLPTVFCQLAPPRNFFKRVDPARVVWIPMWDNVHENEQSWWEALPRQLRIVGFSQAVVARAKRAGLPVLPLKFFANPHEYAPVGWSDGTTLLYWNRVGLVGPDFLRKLCSVLDVDTLLFRPDLDPRIDPARRYELPDHLGKTSVQVISPTDRQSYLAHLREANVFLAPRPYEGVGMTCIEALASGCAVLAHNAPAMSEYITHAENGFLLRGEASPHRRLLDQLHLVGPPTETPFILPLAQDWRALRKLDLRALGARARESQAQGFLRWQASMQKYARFVLGESALTA